MRSAECGVSRERRSAHDPSLQFRIPHSTLRIRGGGGAVKYFVRIGAQTVEVEVDGARVVVGGEELEVHLAAIPGTPLYHLLLGGRSWTVAAQPLDGVGRWALGVVGERVEVEVADERTRQIQALTGAPSNPGAGATIQDRKSTRLNSSHSQISYAVFCLKKKKKIT